MKVSECAPAPFGTDYYIMGDDHHVRGAQVQNITRQFVDLSVMESQTQSKVPNNFDCECILPSVPSDPLYVLPRTSFTLDDTSGVEAANRIVSILKETCPSTAMITTNTSRMRIAVHIDGCLDMKIKLFRHSGYPTAVLVVCRRDAGDWFAFHRVYMQIKNNF